MGPTSPRSSADAIGAHAMRALLVAGLLLVAPVVATATPCPGGAPPPGLSGPHDCAPRDHTIPGLGESHHDLAPADTPGIRDDDEHDRGWAIAKLFPDQGQSGDDHRWPKISGLEGEDGDHANLELPDIDPRPRLSPGTEQDHHETWKRTWTSKTWKTWLDVPLTSIPPGIADLAPDLSVLADPVPQPRTLLLFGAALVLFALIRSARS